MTPLSLSLSHTHTHFLSGRMTICSPVFNLRVFLQTISCYIFFLFGKEENVSLTHFTCNTVHSLAYINVGSCLVMNNNHSYISGMTGVSMHVCTCIYGRKKISVRQFRVHVDTGPQVCQQEHKDNV